MYNVILSLDWAVFVFILTNPFHELNWMSMGWYHHRFAISTVEAAWGQSRTRFRRGSWNTSSQLPMVSVLSSTCLTSSRTSRSSRWKMKSPSLKNPSFSSPTHIGFLALVLNSGINLVLDHRLLLFRLPSYRLMARVSHFHLSPSPSLSKDSKTLCLSAICCSISSTFSVSRDIFISKSSLILTQRLYENPISIAKNDDEGLEAWGSSKLRVFDRAILDITWCEEDYRFYSGWPVCCCYLWGKTYGNFFYIYLIFSQHLIYFQFFFRNLRLHEPCRHNYTSYHYHYRRQTTLKAGKPAPDPFLLAAKKR